MGGTLEVHIDQIGPSTGKGFVRAHSVLIDRPAAKGGADQGPMGGELLLLSLGGCFLSNLLAAAKARDIALSGVQVAITATTGGTPERVEAMHMRVRSGFGDTDTMAKLVSIAEKGCLVTNTLRASVTLSVELEAR